MVRTYWLVPVFYEASGVLDLQPIARDHLEAMSSPCFGAGTFYREPVRAPTSYPVGTQNFS